MNVPCAQMTAELELTKAQLAETKAAVRTHQSRLLDMEAQLHKERDQAAKEVATLTEKCVVVGYAWLSMLFQPI